MNYPFEEPDGKLYPAKPNVKEDTITAGEVDVSGYVKAMHSLSDQGLIMVALSWTLRCMKGLAGWTEEDKQRILGVADCLTTRASTKLEGFGPPKPKKRNKT